MKSPIILAAELRSQSEKVSTGVKYSTAKAAAKALDDLADECARLRFALLKISISDSDMTANDLQMMAKDALYRP